MTVIAADLNSMACDSQLTVDGIRAPLAASKIIRIKGALVGFCGESGKIARIVRKALKSKSSTAAKAIEKAWPEDCDEVAALLLDNAGLALVVEGEVARLSSSYFAVGTGQGIALGALAMMASPRDAVGAAIRHDIYCDGPVLVEDLDD